MLKRLNIFEVLLICGVLIFSFNLSFAKGFEDQVINNIRALHLNEVVSTYTTYFNKNDRNRYQNIKVAAKGINEIIIMPDEVFSFNQIVGSRTLSKGYKKALEIVGGKFIQGVGGGVCQVSSTLYNAVLLANLEVVERANHSRPVSYIPLGRGATVYYGRATRCNMKSIA